MKSAILLLIRVAVWFWVPTIAAASLTMVYAQQGVESMEGGGVHLSVTLLAVIVGILAFVGPGFYMAGRYENRITQLERELARSVNANINAGTRMAEALEEISGKGFYVSCDSCSIKESR